MKSFEFTGKNIEKAIENGLKELGKTREEVDISILAEGGIFSKAKVLISIEEKEENVDTACEIAEAKEECCDENCDCGCEDKDCDCDEHCDCHHIDGECCCGDECHCDESCDCNEHCDCDEKCDCGCHEEVKEVKKERVYLDSEEVYSLIQNIFADIFKALNIEAKVMILENDESYEVKIMGDEKVSSLIGFRGEGLNAYQLLINNFLSLRNKSKKILIDVENYRSKREESLRALANRIAKKVVKTHRKHKFEPMSSYERHVIHEELANFKNVSTHSEGNEPHRCLIVEYAEGDKE